MELTRDAFRKIILGLVVILLVAIGIEYLSFFPDYALLEEQLYQGYIFQLVSNEGVLLISLFLLFLHFISLFLLYFFKPISRTIYTVSYFLMIGFLTLSGDWIVYSLSYPLDVLESFLEFFVLYLIYFTPLKKEFEK